MNEANEIVFNKPQSRPPPDQKKAEESGKKLDKLVEGAQNPLLKIKTCIPLNPFPDEVVVDINKVDIIYRMFFASRQVHSLLIENISDVLVETSPFFATLKLVHTDYPQEPLEVRYLRPHEATKAKRIIEGLVVAHKRQVELERLELDEVMQKMEDLGSTS